MERMFGEVDGTCRLAAPAGCARPNGRPSAQESKLAQRRYASASPKVKRHRPRQGAASLKK